MIEQASEDTFTPSPFYARLEALQAPKKAEDGQSRLLSPRFEIDHIFTLARVFAHQMESNFPTDEKELCALLYVFGELLDGELQKRLQQMTGLASDALHCATPSPMIVPLQPPTDSEVNSFCAQARIAYEDRHRVREALTKFIERRRA